MHLHYGVCEKISRIYMADFQVENTLGLTVVPTHREYWGVAQAKDKLNLEDFIGNALGEDADGNRIPGTNLDCVEEFAVIFQQQYDNMLALGMLGEDPQELEDYLDQFASMGEYDHKEDQPFYKALLSNVLDLTIIKPIIESCCGYDLITGEDLTEMERNMKLIGAVVDLVTLATGIYGFTTAAKSMGWKKAASYFSQLALVELASDVSATTVATIGEYCDWPMGVTLLLSLGTGLTVGQVGNHLIFKRNGIEIFRKEISESGELLEDLMSPEELVGIGKVDDYLNNVDYNSALTVNRGTTTGEIGALNEEVFVRYMADGSQVIDFTHLLGNSGIEIPRRLSVEEMTYLTQEYGVEFAQVYQRGIGTNGGGGRYYVYSGDVRSVNIPVNKDVILINHTHPHGTACPSEPDKKLLWLLEKVGSPQRTSEIIPIGKTKTIKFGVDGIK